MRIHQLDGLRTVAVLLVVSIHHGLLPSGWVGVDIFFVLSGFLITGILRRDAGHPNYWLSFYVKRATRILPPLIALVITVFLMVGHFRPVYLGYLLFASNLVQLTPGALGPLGALWSLAIEEHFYFIWPLAVKNLNRDKLLKLSGGIVLLSPLLRIVGTVILRHLWGWHNNWDNPIFLLTLFRIDGLAAGSALALLLEDGYCPPFLQRWSGVASLGSATLFFGLESIVISFRRTAGSLSFNGFGYSLVVVSSFFLVSFLVLNPNARLTRLLSSKVLVFVGTISYGVYLYQDLAKQISVTLIGTSIPRMFYVLPDLAITLTLATVSFYFFEKPIMAWGKEWLKGSQAKVSRCEHHEVVPLEFQPTENG